MTKGECMALLAIAGRNYGQAIDAGLEEDWAQGLADIPEHLGVAALRAHLRGSRFFPTIADIRVQADALRPRPLYLPPHVPEPLPPGEIRELVATTLSKLKGGC